MQRHLRDDVRRRAEAVQSEPAGFSSHQRLNFFGHAIRAVPDQAGAQQRRRVGVAVSCGQLEAVAGIHDGEVGVAAVAVIAGEACVGTQVLAAVPAVRALAAGVGEPRNADAIADHEALDAVSDPCDQTDDLMAGDERKLRGINSRACGQLAVDNM